MTDSDDERYFSPVRRKLTNGDMAGHGNNKSGETASASEGGPEKDGDEDFPTLGGKQILRHRSIFSASFPSVRFKRSERSGEGGESTG